MMRNEDSEQGTRIWNGVRKTLRPCVNSTIIRGNKDPPCVHMGGTSDPLSRCIIKSKCIGNDAYYPMKCLFEPCKAYKRPCFGQ